MTHTLILPSFYQRYVDLVNDPNLIQALIKNGNEFLDLIREIPEESGNYAYASGKWTIKELIAHVIDAERVFAYRAMRFARRDKTPLPGFEENDYALEANAENRKIYKLAEEVANLRTTTIDLYSSFTNEMLDRSGVSSGHEMSVRALGYIIVGHQIHHSKILTERYLSK